MKRFCACRKSIGLLLVLGAIWSISGPTWARGEDGAPRKKGSASRRQLPADHPETGVQWQPTLAAAMSEARKVRKPVFISFAVRRMANPNTALC